MPHYVTSLFYMALSAALALSYSDIWEIGVKCGAVMTFFLASCHMVLKIRGQITENKLKKRELERTNHGES